jgi:hypothetical protein
LIVAVVLAAIVMLALLSSGVYWAMRVRLMKLDSARDRIEWLSFRSSDEVLSTYQAMFPQSLLPRFCRFIFWTVIICAAVGLCAILAHARE